MRHKRPFIIGLTGSIGMGKSKIASKFRYLNVPVFDADAAVREVQGPNGTALPAIEAAFPGTTGLGGVDRQKLGAAVFGDKAALRRLEQIVHPEVFRLQRRFLQKNRSRRVLVLDIPLLLEGEGWKRVDMVMVASAPFHVQRARVLARPGMNPEKFASVLKHQMPDQQKRALADVVVETGRGRLLTFRTIKSVLRVVG